MRELPPRLAPSDRVSSEALRALALELLGEMAKGDAEIAMRLRDRVLERNWRPR